METPPEDSRGFFVRNGVESPEQKVPMSDRKTSPWFMAAIASSVLLVLLGGYVGMYYATVVPTAIGLEAERSDGVTVTMPYMTDVYRILIDPGTAQWVFGPIHNFDRQFRPHVWKD
jgi:hypothetical protein